MSANEPANWPQLSAEHASEPNPAPAAAPVRDLRVGYDDALVRPPAPLENDGGMSEPPTQRSRPVLNFILLISIAGLFWSVWAAAAFYDLTVGLHDADPVALERRIDWIAVRQALREDLSVRLAAPSGDRAIDALLSERAIANLLRTARLDEKGWDAAALPGAGNLAAFDWQRVSYAFFSGSPFAFRVDIQPDSATHKEPVVLLFRWTGDWRLTRILLPARAADGPALASQTPPPVGERTTLAAPATPATPAGPARPATALPGTERAMLYEEDPKDSRGKLFDGSVTWRLDRIPPAQGGEPTIVVVAQITMPSRPLTAAISIRRNLDQALPASHTIDINFELPASSPLKGVQDMIGIIMKPSEEAPGQNLAGTRVKVRDGIFLFGLSAIELDIQHNMQILKDRPWIGIPFRYGNGNRAVLVVEKGASGNKSLTDAFAQWGGQAATKTGANRN
jgi:hypothetical protein